MQLMLHIVNPPRLLKLYHDGVILRANSSTWSHGMAPVEIKIEKAVLKRWSKNLAALIAEPTRDDLPNELITAMRDLVGFDYSTGYLLRRNAAPLVVYDETPREPVSYIDSPYLLDPAYVSYINGELPLFCNLSALMPDDFRNSEYFAQYYKTLNVVSEVCISVPVAGDAMLHMSVYRIGGSPEFSADDEDLLESLSPIVAEVISKWWDADPVAFSKRDPGADRFHRHLENVLTNFGSSILTAREKQIVHLTMRGYSDKLTARELEITPGTVRNHKKSIFNKLEVSSQGQVFGLFLDVLQQSGDGDAEGDPLATLLNERKGTSPHVS